MLLKFKWYQLFMLFFRSCWLLLTGLSLHLPSNWLRNLGSLGPFHFSLWWLASLWEQHLCIWLTFSSLGWWVALLIVSVRNVHFLWYLMVQYMVMLRQTIRPSCSTLFILRVSLLGLSQLHLDLPGNWIWDLHHMLCHWIFMSHKLFKFCAKMCMM